jgi:hypothetical protein
LSRLEQELDDALEPVRLGGGEELREAIIRERLFRRLHTEQMLSLSVHSPPPAGTQHVCSLQPQAAHRGLLSSAGATLVEIAPQSSHGFAEAFGVWVVV